MLRSMTGFVQERYKEDNLIIFITIKSYNSRTLDVYLKVNLPNVEIEKRALKHIRNYIKRGRVESFVNIFFPKNEDMEVILNKPVIKKIANELKEVEMSSLFINLLEMPGLITINPSQYLLDDNSMDFIEDSIRKTLEKLVKEREREGKEMEKEIIKMTEYVGKLIDKIEERENYQVNKIKRKIEKNIRWLKKLGKIEKIPKEEIFSILRKIDITEEIVRMKAHLKEFKKCTEKDEPVGKKMEFLSLEIQREATSILSKSEDEKISSLAVQIKDYIEKIKEHLRNIE